MLDNLSLSLTRFVLLYFFIVTPTLIIAQEFENVGTEEGLSSHQTYNVVQDKNGFIWVTTKIGIDRCDGENVVNYEYPKINGKAYPSVTKLRIDTQKNLWLYNAEGNIYLFDEGKNRFLLTYEIDKLLTKNVSLTDMYIGNYFWFCTRQGLYFLDPVTQEINEEICFKRKSVELFIPYLKDQFIVACADQLVIYKKGQGIIDTLINAREIDRTNRIRSLSFNESTNELWIGTQFGDILYYDLRLKRIENIRKKYPDLPTVPVNRIISFTNDETFIGSDGGGVFKFDSRQKILLKNFRENEDVAKSLEGNGVRDMYMSNSGDLLVTTFTGGLNILRQNEKSFKTISHSINNSNSLRNNVVNSILEDIDGDMWFATNNGVSCWMVKSNRWIHFFDDFKRNANVFLSLSQYDENTVMTGSYGKGAFLLSKTKGVVRCIVPASHNPKGEDNSDYISEIYRDKENKLWTGGPFNELAVFDPKLNTYTFLPITNVRAIQPKDDEHIFVASSDAILIVNIKTYEYEEVKYKGLLPSNVLTNCLCIDSIKQILWIGTSGFGLIKWDYKTDNFVVINETDGLPSNHLYSILRENENILWISSEKGLIRYDIEIGQIESFTTKDGLSDNAFHRNSGCKTKSGDFYFGSYEGVTFFNPDNIKTKNSNAQIFLEELLLSNRRVLVGEKNSPLKNSLNVTAEIILKYNQNSLTIGFTSIASVNSSNIEYSWKLEGQDDDWTIPSFNKRANYTNLDKGTYLFRLRIVGNRLNEIIDERTMKIRVKPAPWNTMLARILFGLIFLGITLLIFRFLRLSDKKRLSEAKIQFFTNTAHDIKTPLTLASAPLSDLLKSKNLNEKDRYLLDLSVSNLSNLTESVNHLLDFQKSDMGKSQLVLSEVDLVKVVENKLAYFNQLAESRNITLEGKIEPDFLIQWVDIAKIEKVIENLLSNAFKYTKSEGKVTLELTSNYENWTILVKDTGIGIPQAAQKSLFKRYYRGENAINSKVSGIGIGLLLTQNYVLLHKGKITFNSTEDVGSEFIVTFVKGKDHYGSNAKFVNDPLRFKTNKFENKDVDKELSKSNASKMLKLLIVEDNDNLRNYLHNAMSEYYQTDSAEDGQIALVKIEKLLPDIVVSDIGMPNIDGIELANRLKNKFETSHIPIILLTAYSEKKDILKGLECGADDYITKPFDTSILLARIENILKNRQKLRDRFIGYIEYKVDKVSYSDKRDQEFIEKAIALVEENRMNPNLDKEFFAREMFVSTTLLYQKLKGLTGQSPSEFIKIIRLKHAAGLLKENQYSIGEIANLSGFSDAKYFSTCFKKLYGQTPRQFIG